MYSRKEFNEYDVWYMPSQDKFFIVIGTVQDNRNGSKVIMTEIQDLTKFNLRKHSAEQPEAREALHEYDLIAFLSGFFLPVDFSILDQNSVVANIINYGVIPVRRPNKS